MKIKIFTLFPDMLRAMLSESILGRATRAGILDVALIDIRDYTEDKHRRVDDYPFGGGAGMVMAAQPIVDAIEKNTAPDFRGRRIYLSPRGRTFNQRIAEELAREDEIMMLCGHYEGVDQRALDAVIDEELSIGDYVLTGGELGALVVVDAVARLVPGVLGSDESSADESFSTGMLEYPQYTRPADFRGAKVPEVLLGGNHADIEAWRREQSLSLTLARRPELLETAPLDDGDRAMLRRIKRAAAVDAMLRATNCAFERLDLQAADAFPKKWFNAFVPADRRKAAKKICFSGRRHTGALTNAFTMGFLTPAPTEAVSFGETAILYLVKDALLYRAQTDALPAAGLGDFILTDEALTQTAAVVGENHYAAVAAAP